MSRGSDISGVEDLKVRLLEGPPRICLEITFGSAYEAAIAFYDMGEGLATGSLRMRLDVEKKGPLR